MAALHFLTHTANDRANQRLLSMVRERVGNLLREGWHFFTMPFGSQVTVERAKAGMDDFIHAIDNLISNPAGLMTVCIP